MKRVFRKFKILTLCSLFIDFSALYARKHYSEFIGSKHQEHDVRSNNIYMTKSLKGEVKSSCIGILNKLPKLLKEISDSKKFKRELKNYLMERDCYSLDGFLNYN